MSAARSQPILVIACVAALVLLVSPPGRARLEASLVTHMLVQMPILVLVGVGLGRLSAAAAALYVAAWNRGGVTGLMLVLAVAMFWMLPRSMDSALAIMGWAYLAAPARLCNAYLVSDQAAAGAGLPGIGIALSVYFAMRIIFGPYRPRSAPGSNRSIEAQEPVST